MAEPMPTAKIETSHARAASWLTRGDLIEFAGAVLLVTHPIGEQGIYPKVVATWTGRPDTLMVSQEYQARYLGHVEIDQAAYP
jgi:hypothetical protein